MNGRKPTKKEECWLDITKRLGCIVCIESGFIQPFEVDPSFTSNHHIDGARKKDAHLNSIPLCAGHHQHGRNARHQNKRSFEAAFGKESELLEKTKRLVEGLW